MEKSKSKGSANAEKLAKIKEKNLFVAENGKESSVKRFRFLKMIKGIVKIEIYGIDWKNSRKSVVPMFAIKN